MRIQRRFLLRSRWTALQPQAGGDECHFEVIEVRGDTLVLRAILTHRDVELDVHALDDATAWATGWIPLSGTVAT